MKQLILLRAMHLLKRMEAGSTRQNGDNSQLCRQGGMGPQPGASVLLTVYQYNCWFN